ncbi:hypothetical protein M3Y94_00809700 [Aphelenchoides besseyi]|nr:hypothetical protein M3Y94_00809700 [Aphelenchoides besseyi]KAI6227218.1 hypothetical protein M3Y95_00703500 [Aphelenchoides besseyi]
MLIVGLICAIGIVKEFRPATPFLTPFLESSSKNFTNAELYSEVYPFWTYSYLLFIVPIFFLTDYLRYKPIVILETASLTGTWIFLVWGKTIWQIQVAEVMFGIATSSEIAYLSYAYAVVEKRHYKKVTSYVRTAALIGKFFAFSMAQIMVTNGYGSLLLLNQISLGAVALTFFIALVVPPAPKQLLSSHRVLSAERVNEVVLTENNEQRQSHLLPLKEYPGLLYSIFKNRTIFMWSLWWALSTCGSYQVANYAQTLWAPMQNEGQFVGNGFVECANTLISACLTFSLQYYKLNYQRYGSKLFVLSSLVSAALLLLMALTEEVLLSYALYVINSSVYHLLIAVASSIIATELNSSNYSLVFGFNTFVALIFQSMLTFIVNDKHTLALPIRSQFFVYSAFFAAIALLFTFVALALTFYRPQTTNESHNLDEETVKKSEQEVL